MLKAEHARRAAPIFRENLGFTRATAGEVPIPGFTCSTFVMLNGIYPLKGKVKTYTIPQILSLFVNSVGGAALWTGPRIGLIPCPFGSMLSAICAGITCQFHSPWATDPPHSGLHNAVMNSRTLSGANAWAVFSTRQSRMTSSCDVRPGPIVLLSPDRAAHHPGTLILLDHTLMGYGCHSFIVTPCK